MLYTANPNSYNNNKISESISDNKKSNNIKFTTVVKEDISINDKEICTPPLEKEETKQSEPKIKDNEFFSKSWLLNYDMNWGKVNFFSMLDYLVYRWYESQENQRECRS